MPTPVLVSDTSRIRYRSKEWWMPTPGVRLPADARALADRCDAMLAVAPPEAVLTGQTGAAMWPMPVPDDRHDACIEITVGPDTPRMRRAGVRCRRRDLDPRAITVRDGRRVLTPEHLFVDLGADLWLPALVAMGDAAYRAGLMTERDVIRALARSSGHRGVRKARQALAMLDDRAESPRESILRVLILLAGLPRPVPQFEVYDERGLFIARVDLAFLEQMVAIEYDGAHHLDRRQQARDAVRRQELEMAGWLVVTLTWHDLRDPRQALRRIEAALASR